MRLVPCSEGFVVLTAAPGPRALFKMGHVLFNAGVPELANCCEETHMSSAFLSRMPATTAAMSVHLAVSALS
jgi:hypothetical protein